MNTLNIRASKSTWLTTLAGLSLAFGAGTTVAEQGTTDTLPAITVEYVALDLATPAGAEALYKRIKAAAAKVCERYENRELAKRAVALSKFEPLGTTRICTSVPLSVDTAGAEGAV